MEADIKVKLDKEGWVSIGQEVGRGGGGVAELCYAKAFLNDLGLGLAPIQVAYPAQRGENLAKALASFHDAIVVGTPAVMGVAKIPKKPSARFRREIGIMKSIVHPHLAKLLAADSSDEPAWLVMEYYPRRDLKANQSHYLGKPLEVLQRVRGVAHALVALHSAGVRHRDIKPNNIFVAADGRWVLGDLGIAYVDAEERLTAPDDSLFSHNWRPDWVANHVPDEYSPVVDVYMLAKTIYYMISGRNGPASQLRTKRYDLTEVFPGRPEIRHVWEFLCEHIVVHEEDSGSKTAEEFLAKLDELIQSLTSEPKMVFSFVSSSPTTHVGANSRFNPAVYIGAPARRLLFRYRVVGQRDSAGRLLITLHKNASAFAVIAIDLRGC